MSGKVVGASIVALGLIGVASAYSSPSPTPLAEIILPAIGIPAKDPATPKQGCNPNYSGCLRPDASDYDCEDGPGDGPYYTGAVRVIGYDEYGLDRDGNGWGCE